ncbi:MAG: hypothetical protein DWI22_01275 [Planctomycetota bacterium]|nr:MAG: hypothetical protein DWI22_01275 [Planctomycetota bacterium]
MTKQTLEQEYQKKSDGSIVHETAPVASQPSLKFQDPSSVNGAALVNESSVSKSIGWGSTFNADDSDYVPVSPWAPIALCMGLLGLTGFIGYFGLYVAFFGIFIGIGAVKQIRASGGFVKGTWMAMLGLVLSICNFCLGSAKMSYDYQHEVPAGYQRVNFQKDVAEKQFVFVGGYRKLAPEVASVIGKKVYLKGFMYATQATDGLRQFILLKDNGECCFGGKPKSHDYVIVTLPFLKSSADRPAISRRAPGMSVVELNEDSQKKLVAKEEYQDEKFQMVTRAFVGMVAVAGVLEADVRAGTGGPRDDFEYAPVYKMKNVELVEEAWTRF